MNWLKRVLQRWLEIEPRTTTTVAYHYPDGKTRSFSHGKCTGVKAGTWMN